MKGFGGFGNSPAKDMKTGKYEHSFESPAKQKKKKGKLQGPIDKQNLPLQPGEMEGTWIYGRGYDNEEVGKYPQSKSERIIDYDERAGVLEQNDLSDINHMLKKDPKNKKLLSQKKKLKKTIKNLDHEAQLMRDRS